MPSFVIHAVAPTLAMLAMRRYFDPRVVLLLWPLTFVPDLDYFFGTHRATTTSLFVTLLPVGFLYAWTLWGPPGAARFEMHARVALVYVGSHLLMDTFTGGIVPFYPLSSWTFCWEASVWVHTPTNRVEPTFGPCHHEGAPVVSEWYPFLDWDQASMLAFLLVAWAGYAAARIVERRRDGRSRQ